MATRLHLFVYVSLGLLSGLGMLFPLAYAQELSPIVVTATRTPVPAENTLSDFVVITHDEIEQAGHSSLTELLQAQRGVQIDSYGGSGNISGVHLRGSSNSQAVLLLDGVRIESSNTGGPILNLIPLALIDHIEIVFGSQSTLYGANALGGVIQIFTRQGDGSFKYGLETGYGSFGTSQGSAHVLGSFDEAKKTQYSLGVTRETSSGFNTIASNNMGIPYGYPQIATGFTRTALVGGISHEWQSNQKIDFKVFSSYDLRQYPESDADSNNSLGSPYTGFIADGVNKFTALSLGLNNQLTDQWLSALKLTKVFNFSQNIWPHAGFAGSNDSNDMPESSVSWQNKFKINDDILQLIFERREQSISTQYSFDQSRCSTPSSCNFYQSRITDSIATSYSLERGNHLLNVSLREDAITGFNNRPNAGVSYGYKFSSDLKGVIDLSTGYRVPTFGDLYYPIGSNPNLNPESSKNAELGVTYSSSIINAKIFAFQNDIHNFIEPASNAIHPDQDLPINIGSARLNGLSSGIDLKLGPWKLSSGLDYTQATDKNTGNTLPRISKFSSNLKLDYQATDWNVGAVMTSSGSTFDEITNKTSTINTPFVLFNLYGSYKLDKHLTVFTRLNNVMNTQYQTAFGYAMPGFNGFGGVRYSLE